MRAWAALLCLWFAALPARAEEQEINTLAVMADETLALPMAELARRYAAKRRMSVSVAYLSAGSADNAVAQSAYADVLVSAGHKRLEEVKNQGIADLTSEKEVARGRLALVGAKDGRLDLSLDAAFPTAALIRAMHWQPMLLLGNPETLEEGTLARESLKRLKVAADLEPYILYIKRKDEMARLVAAQGAYAILYASDAARMPGVRVIDRLPEHAHAPIVYKAVALAGDRMEEARSFIDYLQGAEAQRVFAQYGFSAPGVQP